MKTPEERFWAKVNKIPNGCWEWTASTTSMGYGQFGLNYKMVAAHRYSYELHNGPITNGLHICHHCDNRICVNPAHLFLGSHDDNMEDMVVKNRQPKGIMRMNSKLTEADVLDIRTRQLSYQEYVKKYGVSVQTIYNIWNRKIWTHI